jgi:(4S)-4-hydroxy-5-phosphonooxypentane-2,3-dione isomerase
MYAILGIIKVKPEHLKQFVENVRDHVKNSVREPGCLCFDVLQDIQDPQTICLYEVFRSEADLEMHREQDYYKRWMEMSRDWRDTDACSRRVLDYIYPADNEWMSPRVKS